MAPDTAGEQPVIVDKPAEGQPVISNQAGPGSRHGLTGGDSNAERATPQDQSSFEPVTDPAEPRAKDSEQAVMPQTTLHLTNGEVLKTEMFRNDVLNAVGKAKNGFVELANDVNVALGHIVHF